MRALEEHFRLMVLQVRARPLGANLGYKLPVTNSMKSTTEPTSLTSASFEELVREMIVRLGEDPDREGLTRTPERVAKAMQYLVKGYKEDPEALLREALFTVTYDEIGRAHV